MNVPPGDTTTMQYLRENLAVHELPGFPSGAITDDSIEVPGVKQVIRHTWALGPAMVYVKELALFLFEYLSAHKEYSKTRCVRNSKTDRDVLLVGNGPSKGFLDTQELREFRHSGGEIIGVNYWPEDQRLGTVEPDFLVVSDPSTLNPKVKRDRIAQKNDTLERYLLAHDSVGIIAPFARVNEFSVLFGGHRVWGFCDRKSPRSLRIISPLLPRSYSSMTLYKALALTVFMGYKRIFVIGMDNTYPRDIYVSPANVVLNIERHSGESTYVNPLPHRSVAARLRGFARLFEDAGLFSKYPIWNLDPFSLTDAFAKSVPSDVLLGEVVRKYRSQ